MNGILSIQKKMNLNGNECKYNNNIIKCNSLLRIKFILKLYKNVLKLENNIC